MTILIIGSAGAIGSGLNDLHLERGDVVTTISRTGADFNMDLRSDADVSNVAARLTRERKLFSRVYVASGIMGAIRPIMDIDLDEFRACLEVNLLVPVKIIKHFSDLIAKNGSMVFFTGGGAANQKPYFTPYATSKTALVRLIESVAHENCLSHVRFYAIGPGPFKSNMLQTIKEAGTNYLSEEELFAVEAVLRETRLNQQGKISKIVSICDALDQININKVSGRFYSAAWDDISSLSENIDSNIDAYTLRRIDSKYLGKHPL
jgi:NAD(P)-dependent dehydrogenase (short-subunit alcohol dehydrogenase family)